MKKIMTLMLGLSLLSGATVAFAGQDPTASTTKKAKKAKKAKKTSTVTSNSSK